MAYKQMKTPAPVCRLMISFHDECCLWVWVRMISDQVTPRNWFRRLILFFSFLRVIHWARALNIREYMYFFKFFYTWLKKYIVNTHDGPCTLDVLLLARTKIAVIGQCKTFDLSGWKITLDWLSQRVFLFFFFPSVRVLFLHSWDLEMQRARHVSLT